MQSASRRTRRTAAVVAGIALTLAACGDDSAGPDSTSPDTAVETTAPGSSAPATTAPDTTVPEGTSPATTSPDGTAPETTTAGSADTADPTDATDATDTTDTTDTSDATAATDAPSSSSPSGPPATYVVEDGDTLFGIAADAGVTVDELVAANGWPDGDEHTIFPGDVVQLPASNGGSTTAGAGEVPEDAVSAQEVLELELTDGTSTPIAEPLIDGVYFTIGAEPTTDDSALELELVQFETTEACEARLAESTAPGDTTDAAECTGYHVIESPSATIELPVDSDAPVIVLLPAPPDVVDLLAYETTVDVWRQLIAGEGPEWSTQWLEGGAFVEVTDGEVTRVEVSVIGS